MKYKVDWKTFDVTIEKDKFIIVIDSNNLPRGISTYKNGDEPATERLFKEGCRWEYWDNIINGSFIPSHQYNCSVEIPSDIIVETDLEKQEKVKKSQYWDEIHLRMSDMQERVTELSVILDLLRSRCL